MKVTWVKLQKSKPVDKGGFGLDGKTVVTLCERCGEEDAISLPLSISAFTKECQAIEKRHKGCLPKPLGV